MRKGDRIHNSPIFFWHRIGNLTYFNFSSYEKILKFDIFWDIIENLSFSHIHLYLVSPTALLPSISLLRPVTRGGHACCVCDQIFHKFYLKSYRDFSDNFFGIITTFFIISWDLIVKTIYFKFIKTSWFT